MTNGRKVCRKFLNRSEFLLWAAGSRCLVVPGAIRSFRGILGKSGRFPAINKENERVIRTRCALVNTHRDVGVIVRLIDLFGSDERPQPILGRRLKSPRAVIHRAKAQY